MNTLIIDSTSDRLYILLLKKDGIICANSETERTLHSGIINLKIAEILETHPISRIHAIAVNVGPGSFTGIRVGISTAYGLCAPNKMKLIEVNTHEILSFCARGIVNTFIPANGGQMYFAKMKRGEFLTHPSLISAEEYSGLSMGRSETLSEKRDYTKELCCAVRKKINKKIFSEKFSPLYIQKSQAEKNLTE